MKIGFDAKRAFLNSSGLGVYSRSLLHYLIKNTKNELYLYTSKKTDLFDVKYSKTLVHIIEPIHFVSKRLNSIWRTYQIARLVRKNEVKIYHGLSGELPYRLGKKVKKIVTIHDILFEKFPEDYPIFDRFFYSWKAKYACYTADIIVAISKATQRELEEKYSVPQDKIKVIPVAISTQKWKATTRPHPRPYIMMVSSFIPRKNQELLIRAYITIAEKVDYDLVLIGSGREYLACCKSICLESRYKHKIYFIENATDEMVASYYQFAKFSVYTSKYEGFGIPILESMKYECPVVLSDNLVHKEVGGDVPFYFQDNNLQSLQFQLLELDNLTEKEKTNWVQRSQVHLKKYDEDAVYSQYLDLYKEV